MDAHGQAGPSHGVEAALRTAGRPPAPDLVPAPARHEHLPPDQRRRGRRRPRPARGAVLSHVRTTCNGGRLLRSRRRAWRICRSWSRCRSSRATLTATVDQIIQPRRTSAPQRRVGAPSSRSRIILLPAQNPCRVAPPLQPSWRLPWRRCFSSIAPCLLACSQRSRCPQVPVCARECAYLCGARRNISSRSS